MADRYAPALFLEVLAFWFVLRWLLRGRAILFFRRVLVLMMVVGAVAMLGEHDYLWAACFAASALLALGLLRRWRSLPRRRLRFRMLAFRPWQHTSPSDVATLCEQRVGLHVDAAAPAIVSSTPLTHCVLALAGDGVWVLEDESRPRRAQIGRVIACWDRTGMVAHVEGSRRGERFELSWPRQSALVRGVMPSGPCADLLAGQLIADEFARRT